MRLILLLLITVTISTTTSTATYAFHKEHLFEHKKTAADKSSTLLDSDEVSRGELLYNNHCRVCHESNVHIRNDRKAKSTTDIIYWVTRWSTHLKLNWSVEDKHDVAHHLNERFYKFNLSDK